MTNQKNLLQRAVDAIVEGRTRQAQRYVERFERDYGSRNKVNGR